MRVSEGDGHMKRRGLSTELIHRGEEAPVRADSVNVPIYETTTFLFENADEVRRYQEGKVDKYLYSRYANPTVVVTEQKIAALDRAEAALVFASGMAATSTLLLTFLSPGDELLCSAAIYGGTFHLVNDVLTRLGIDVRFATLEEFENPAALLGPTGPGSAGSSRRSIRRSGAWMSRGWRGPAARPACCRCSTTRSPARSTSSRWRSAWTWPCRARPST